jgi:hypothetical protein
MVTDPLPRLSRLLEEYRGSDQLSRLDLPDDTRLRSLVPAIEEALRTERCAPVRTACTAFLAVASDFHCVSTPPIQVLAARPLKVQEGGWSTELFGDYRFEEKLIRVWMRTAIQKRVTSFGTFLSTLCHEFCHHLDRERFGFSETPHTRGFYARTAALYHHVRATPAKPLFWRPLPNGCWRIDWPRTNQA